MISNSGPQYRFETWFETKHAAVSSTANTESKRSSASIWTVKQDREKPPIVDPRVKKYAEMMGIERVMERLAGEGRKLTLVLDLDLTLVEAVKEEVFATLTASVQASVSSLCQRLPPLLICKRPGLDSFLSSLSRFYSLHLYSHGHPTYVRQVLSLIDPGNAFFQDRVTTPLSMPTAIVGKRLSRVCGLTDMELAIVFDDQPEIWTSDLCVLPSKSFIPSGCIERKSSISLSTLSQKFEFQGIPGRLLLAGAEDRQLEDIEKALVETYVRFVGNGERHTAAFELSEVRKAVLRGEAFSFRKYLRRVDRVKGYKRERYKLYHFAASALGGSVGEEGREVVEKNEGSGEVEGKWLVDCFLHIRKM